MPAGTRLSPLGAVETAGNIIDKEGEMEQANIQKRSVEAILRPFQNFFQTETAGGMILLVCAVIALLWANSPWSASYAGLWQTKLTLSFGDTGLSKPLLLWINDALMAIFFLLVGLEIKREVLVGELSSLQQASLPLAAALGGMLVPAGIYTLLNAGTAGSAGWGIPMATDIAFSLGVLALLGRQIPLELKIFLTALAIVDDIGAVLVISIFYTAQIVWSSLAVALGILALLFVANRSGITHPLVYTLLGIALWLAVFQSGVHATVAGVLLAMTIPANRRIDAAEFIVRSRQILDEFQAGSHGSQAPLMNEEQRSALEALEHASAAIEPPLQRMERALHPWVAFGIMPLFALANAGVQIGGTSVAGGIDTVTLGVIAGLVLGKPLGIMLASWLAIMTGLARKPAAVTWRQIGGASCLAGIGFTMSLFIADLAFGDAALLTAAKLGILIASLVSGIAGWFILWLSSRETFAGAASAS